MSTKAKKGAKGMTKAEVLSNLATAAGLTKTQIGDVLTALESLATAELQAGRPFTIPGIAKLTATRKAAVAAHPGRNPFTGAAIMVAAKPAHNVVRAKLVKSIKDAVA